MRLQFLLDAPALVDELARLAARAARIGPLLRLLTAGALLALGTQADPGAPPPGAPSAAAEPEAAGVHADPNPKAPNLKTAPAAAALLAALVARVPLGEGEAAAVAAGVLRAAAAAGESDTAALQPVLRCAAYWVRCLSS